MLAERTLETVLDTAAIQAVTPELVQSRTSPVSGTGGPNALGTPTS